MQTIRRAGTQASMKGPEDFFTGTARIDPLFPKMEGSNVSAALVTFEPGARSAWHTHGLRCRSAHIAAQSIGGDDPTLDGDFDALADGPHAIGVATVVLPAFRSPSDCAWRR